MHPASTTKRLRRALAFLLTACLGLMTLPSNAVAAEVTDLVAFAENLFHQRHNETRQDPAANGVTDAPAAPSVPGRTDLLQTARAWSAHMSSNDQLQHNPNLADEVCCWSRVGENVAYYRGPLDSQDQVRAATERLMDAWISSDGHRRNIMDARWDQFGVGVVIEDGAIWATAVFRTLDGSSTPPGTAYGSDGPHATAGRDAASTSAQQPKAQATSRDTTDTCADVAHDGYADSNGTAHDASIRCASGHGLAQGRTSEEYAPAGSVTRGQIMSFVRRAVEMSGNDIPSDVPDYFNDDNGTVHEASANMLAHAGWVPVGDGKLQPNAPATRAFTAAVTGRMLADLLGSAATADYFDDDNGHADEEWINVLAEAGIVTGSSNRTFGADLGLTRGQMATIIVRAFDALRT